MSLNSALSLHFEDDGFSGGKNDIYSDQKAFNILEPFLQPNGGISVEKASKLLLEILQPGRGIPFGGLVCEASQQIPYQHTSQVKLVKLLQRLAELNKRESWDEFHDLLCGFQDPNFDGSVADQYSKYINFSSFLARLTESNFVDDDLFAILTLRDALERDGGRVQDQNCLISASAVWVLYCGQSLFVRIVQVPKTLIGDGERNSRKPGPLFNGPIYGLERWKFWGKALAVAVESEELNEESRRLASKAVDLMNAIERNMTL